MGFATPRAAPAAASVSCWGAPPSCFKAPPARPAQVLVAPQRRAASRAAAPRRREDPSCMPSAMGRSAALHAPRRSYERDKNFTHLTHCNLIVEGAPFVSSRLGASLPSRGACIAAGLQPAAEGGWRQAAKPRLSTASLHRRINRRRQGRVRMRFMLSFFYSSRHHTVEQTERDAAARNHKRSPRVGLSTSLAEVPEPVSYVCVSAGS